MKVRFEPFELDLSSGELSKRGRRIRIQPLPSQVLALLLERPGQVVTREELHRNLWTTDTFVDFEAGLNTAIKKLREALGDSPDSPRFIETLPRRGYRFVAAVNQASEGPGPEAASRPRDVPIASPSGTSGWRAAGMATAGLALVAATVASLTLSGRRPLGPEALSHARIQSIAVLPFKALAGRSDPSLELGMADALITKLSNIRQIVVRPTGSVLKYSGTGNDPLAAGRELNVDAVLDGTVQQADDRIRVTARLVSVQDGRALWGEQFDESWTQIFTVQDSISERVVRALTLELSGRERERLTRRDTENLDAYRAYLLGRYHLNRRTPDGVTKAGAYLEKAITLDPTYALAYSGLADSYALIPAYTGGPPKDPFAKARAAALKAVQLDGIAAEPHASLAFIRVHYDFDWPGAEREFKRALELNPNYATAHQWYAGSYLSLVERRSDAIAEAKRALELDPLSLIINAALGRCYYYAHLYDDAIEQYHRTLEIDRHFGAGHLFLAKAYAQTGKYEQALTELREANGETVEAKAVSGYAYAASGQRAQATRVLNELLELAQHQYVPRYHIATIYAGFDDRQQALTWLEKAYEERDQWLCQLKVEPMFDRLRGNQRFQALVNRIFDHWAGPPEA
jgi:TolB-like protein/DNA-binding winged helix-turn-helix (wHTH) protein/Flp pilus assembly protein TadD